MHFDDPTRQLDALHLTETLLTLTILCVDYYLNSNMCIYIYILELDLLKFFSGPQKNAVKILLQW